MKKVTDFLQELGLTEIEALIYHGLLETGPTTVKGLADHIGMKRITTHFNVESLIDKGLIIQTVQGARRQIMSEQPERLEYLIEKKEEQISQLHSKLPDILKEIYQHTPKSQEGEKFTIKYYDDKKGVQSIYIDMLKANEVHSFINLDKYYDIFPGTANMFWNALNKNKKRQVWDIAIESSLAKQISKGHPRYYCKFLSHTSTFSGFDILIYDDKVAIIQLEFNNTMGLIINSEMMYHSLKALHQAMWNLMPSQKVD